MTLRIQVRDDHYVLLGANGDELMTSKQYTDEAGARRSAANLHDHLGGADVVLEVAEATKSGRGKSSKVKWTRTEVLAENRPVDNPVSADALRAGFGGGPVVAQAKTITPPPDGKSGHALSPLATSNPE